MKKILSIIPFVLLAVITFGQPPKGAAEKGMVFGSAVTKKNAIKSNELPSVLNIKKDAQVKVIGKVIEVCQAEGCWLKMEIAEGNIMVRMKAHSYFVPVSLNGKTIIAEGTASVSETTVQMLRHYAADAGKSKEEIAAINSPKKEILIQATGILVM